MNDIAGNNGTVRGIGFRARLLSDAGQQYRNQSDVERQGTSN